MFYKEPTLYIGSKVFLPEPATLTPDGHIRPAFTMYRVTAVGRNTASSYIINYLAEAPGKPSVLFEVRCGVALIVTQPKEMAGKLLYSRSWDATEASKRAFRKENQSAVCK